MEQREKGVVRTQFDGQLPLTTFYLRAMDEETIKRYGLMKYLRKDVRNSEQGS